MLLLNAKIEGDKVVIDGLKKLERNYPAAVRRGLGRIVKGVNKEAVALLSGPGAKGTTTGGRFKRQSVPPGGYPVPVRTGHLRRSENFVLPGRTKTTGGQAFSAGPLSAIAYNAASYARDIFEGRGSSRKYGRRPALTDAVTKYDRGGRIIRDLDEEVGKEI